MAVDLSHAVPEVAAQTRGAFPVAPIAFWLIYKFGRARWLMVLVPVLLLSLAASILAAFVAPTAGFFVLPTRAWELVLGAVVAVGGHFLRLGPVQREALSAAGVALILYGMLALDEGDPFPGWNALFPCADAALIIVAGVGCAGAQMPVVNRLIATSPFVWIGLISYSLYLVHWPIAAFSRYLLLRDPSLSEAAAMFTASVLLAWLSWRFVEQPFRRISFERRNSVLWAGAGTVAAVVAVGTAGVAVNGLPGRYAGFTTEQIAGVEDWGGDRCFNQNQSNATPWDAKACTRITGSGGRILLWGDSFAAQYVPGILRDAERINADVLQYTFAGCPPVLAYNSFARLACAPFNRNVLNIVRDHAIDTVVLAARWSDTPSHTLDRLGETVAALKELGVRVFVFGQSPFFASDVQKIDYIAGKNRDLGRVSWNVAFDPALNVRLDQQARGAIFVDPLQYLCQASLCPYRDGATYLYADYGHFSREGSLRAVRAYFPAGSKLAAER